MDKILREKEKKFIQNVNKRVKIYISFVIILFFLLIFRLYYIQIILHKKYKKIAFKQHWRKKILYAKRGTIFDRNGVPLAFSILAYSCYTDPKFVKNPLKISKILSNILNIRQEVIYKKLTNLKKRFIWLKRGLLRDTAEKIKSYRFSGIYFKREYKRIYPYKEIGAHLIGCVNIDEKGLVGVELKFDKVLRGIHGYKWVLKDGRLARWRIYTPFSPNMDPINGSNIYLTIDIKIQYFLEKELDKICKKYRPKGVVGIVMNVKTGEVLALGCRPTFDPNNFNKYSLKNLRNRAITDAYELGSVMKPLVIAGALSENIVSLNTLINCERGRCRIIKGRILHDTHPYGLIPVSKIIIKSSNIGTAKIGLKMGKKRVYKYLKLLGFGEKTGIELNGEAKGNLKPLNKWTDFTLTSVPIGHEICITPIQMISAYSCLANEGIYISPTIIYKIESLYYNGKKDVYYRYPSKVKRIFPKYITRKLWKVLRDVVKKGTARRANRKLIEIAGKTGTAQKIVNGRYSHRKYISVFVGFAPAFNPKVSCIIMVDEPKGAYYGGTVSAPSVGKVLEKVILYLKYREKFGTLLLNKR